MSRSYGNGVTSTDDCHPQLGHCWHADNGQMRGTDGLLLVLPMGWRYVKRRLSARWHEITWHNMTNDMTRHDMTPSYLSSWAESRSNTPQTQSSLAWDYMTQRNMTPSYLSSCAESRSKTPQTLSSLATTERKSGFLARAQFTNLFVWSFVEKKFIKVI